MRATATPAAASGCITTAEVGKKHLGGVTPQTVRRYINEKGLPAHRVGLKMLFDPAEVEAWLRSRDTARLVAPLSGDDLDAHVHTLVDSFPPLTEEQVNKVALMLRGKASTGTDADGNTAMGGAA